MKITEESHLDHGLDEEHLKYIKETFGYIESFIMATVVLPQFLADVPCSLYGPIMGDEPVGEEEVTYRIRGKREGYSRVVDRPVRWVRHLSVIIGPHEGEVILYTAFGGPIAVREPFDSGLEDEDSKAESLKFWSSHALAMEELK